MTHTEALPLSEAELSILRILEASGCALALPSRWRPATKHPLPLGLGPGAHAVHAVGWAWASRLEGRVQATIVLLDAVCLTSPDTHNALNFGAVFNTPCLFVALAPLADLAQTYGLPLGSASSQDPSKALLRFEQHPTCALLELTQSQ